MPFRSALQSPPRARDRRVRSGWCPGIIKMQQDPLHVWKAEFFKALAHPARLRILEFVRGGERSAGDIVQALGMEQSNASKHLSVLRTRNLLVSRREGTTILYSARDPVLYDVLDLLRTYFHEQLSEVRGLLEALGCESMDVSPEALPSTTEE